MLVLGASKDGESPGFGWKHPAGLDVLYQVCDGNCPANLLVTGTRRAQEPPGKGFGGPCTGTNTVISVPLSRGPALGTIPLISSATGLVRPHLVPLEDLSRRQMVSVCPSLGS